MKTNLILAVFLLLGWPGLVPAAEPISKEQIKGLDEQLQEIKSEVISIAAELNLLEEKLLYPSHSQVALFVAMAAEQDFRLDSLSISIDGATVADHIYSFKELEALQKGGVQRIYSGNLTNGNHQCLVRYSGLTSGGKPFTREHQFSLKKGNGPGFGEIVLTQAAASFNDR